MIKTVHDYRAIDDFLAKKDPKCDRTNVIYLIGSYKLVNESMLLDVDGTRTSFQMFDLLELFDENSFQSKLSDYGYMAVFCEKRKANLLGVDIGHIFSNVPHHNFPLEYSIICEFKHGTPCFDESDE
ncbi:hypothetical protein Fcan01_05396, partial [Folsomia candida]